MKHLVAAIFSSFLFANILFGQTITIDESYADWQAIPSLHSTNTHESELRFTHFKMTNDNRFLYVYVETGIEVNLQNTSEIRMFIDADNNPQTGINEFGIGYDLMFSFSERFGTVYQAEETSIGPYDIGLISAPTVSSEVFEFCLSLDTRINDRKLFTADSISIVFQSPTDQLPEEGAVLTYGLTDTPYQAPSYSLNKNSPTDLRVLSYNVLRDNLFNPSVRENYRRIFEAIQPDIIGFQEIYNHSGDATAQRMNELLPLNNGQRWYAGHTGNDNILVSKYPIIKEQSLGSNAAFLVDYNGQDIMVMVAHPPCCTNDVGRQEEFDQMMAFLRDSKNGEEFDLAENTPILIVGDMNLVGLARQQTTLLSGDIENEERYGEDFAPDWDGTALEDAKPNNPEIPTTFTWYSESSSFGAGRLDYIVYSGSKLELQNSLSLHSPALSPDSLASYTLEWNDTIVASDHLPVVADFTIKQSTALHGPTILPDKIQIFQNYPNPFNPTTTLRYAIAEAGLVQLNVFNIQGQVVKSIPAQRLNAGLHTKQINLSGLPSGTYMVRLSSQGVEVSQKIQLIK